MNDHPLGVKQKFWEDDILREFGKICVSFPYKCVKCLPMHLWPIECWEPPGTVKTMGKTYKFPTILESSKFEDHKFWTALYQASTPK